MRYVLRNYSKSIPVQVLIDNDKQAGRATPELAQLPVARFVSCSEWAEDAYLNEARVKSMTGCTALCVRHLYGTPFEFTPQFKLLIDTNHLPSIKGSDYGIWRRIHIISFDVTFKPKDIDKSLLEKLTEEDEAEAILAWIVEGAVNYYSNGIPKCEIVKKATKDYKKNEDTVQQFLDDCTEQVTDGSCSAKELYLRYMQYCDDSGKTALTQTSFGKRLTAKRIDKKKNSKGITYIGINLK